MQFLPKAKIAVQIGNDYQAVVGNRSMKPSEHKQSTDFVYSVLAGSCSVLLASADLVHGQVLQHVCSGSIVPALSSVQKAA